MSDAPKKILFICTGNICRSAMAEHLLRRWSDEKALGLTVRSCGTAAESWYEMPEHARALLAAEGVPPFEHRPSLLTREQLRWADIVLVMTRGHYEHVVGLYPEFTRRTKLLREHAGFGELDVDDPMGGSREVFADCLQVLKDSLGALLPNGFRGADEP